MGSFTWPWSGGDTARRLDAVLAHQDLTRRLEGRNPTCERIDQFLESLHQRIGLSLSAAVNIAGEAPVLNQLASATETTGRDLARAADTIASTSEEIATTVETELVPGAQEMAVFSTQVATALRQCEAGSGQVLEHIGTISHSERQLGHAIERLQSQLEEVAQVIGVIADISKQTNLLSLNAAIEAARAGVHGRGFAVVAEEVRRLAHHTTDATDQVAAIIERFRGDMNELTQAGDHMQCAVNAGEQGVHSMRSELSSVRGAMDELDTRVGAMATGTAQIGAAIGAMNEDVHTVSTASNQMLESASRVTALGQSVHRQSDTLLEGLGDFQLQLHHQVRAAVEALARQPLLLAGDAAAVEINLRHALERDPRFELLYLVDAGGCQLTANIFAEDLRHLDGSAAQGRDWSQRHWFRAVLASRQPHISGVYRSSATDAFCFTVAVPLMDAEGRLQRVLGADVRLSALTG